MPNSRDKPDALDGFPLEHWLQLCTLAREHPGRVREALVVGGAEPAYLGKGLAHLQPLVAHQVRLRPRVARKFDDPAGWLWTDGLLQLASDDRVAALTAGFFPKGARVFDIGCGGGADALALLGRGPVAAVDREELPLALAAANAALQAEGGRRFGGPLESIHSDAAELTVGGDDLLHLDPDRRGEGGQRSVQLRWHSPDETTLVRLIGESRGGSVKLAPGCRDEPPSEIADVTRQWVGVDRGVVQQRWWWGIDGFPAGGRRVSALVGPDWHHFDVPADRWREAVAGELSDVVTEEFPSPGSWLGDGDPTLRAADCQGVYAAAHGYELLGNEMGYFAADAPANDPSSDPLVRWFRLEDAAPLDARKLRRLVQSMGRDGIVLKTRNVRSVPEPLVKWAAKPAKNPAVVMATAFGGRHWALVVKPA